MRFMWRAADRYNEKYPEQSEILDEICLCIYTHLHTKVADNALQKAQYKNNLKIVSLSPYPCACYHLLTNFLASTAHQWNTANISLLLLQPPH